jgi:hypothetical protein
MNGSVACTIHEVKFGWKFWRNCRVQSGSFVLGVGLSSTLTVMFTDSAPLKPERRNKRVVAKREHSMLTVGFRPSMKIVREA